MTDTSWTYKKAGVDIEAGKQVVEAIREHVRRTHRPGVMTDIGGFGGLFKLATEDYHEPILVSSTDGVGTKIKIAQGLDKHDTVGIDLVAMCVNDVLTMGAEPLFFLDYIACGKVDPNRIAELVKGISQGCIEAGCALLGGETAEMPDLYDENEYDLAGFSVGVVDKANIIDGSHVTEGDIIVGLPSSGLHSNGFSLVSKLFPSLDREESLAFLNPTRIYVKPVLAMIKEFDIHALAHITGGGLVENIGRLLPSGLDALINTLNWEAPDVFDKIRDKGSIKTEEMFSVFNMGIGMVVILPDNALDELKQLLSSLEESFLVIGKITRGQGYVVLS